MDPITIGTAVGVAVVSQVTKKLMEKAVDPENVAKSVNWVFAAVDHFLKIRKGEKEEDAPIQPPPRPTPPAEPPAEVDDLEAENMATAVQGIAQSLQQEAEAPKAEGIRLVDMDDFALDQLAREVESLMKQLEIYLDTLRFEEEKAALHGGVAFAPPIVMHTIRVQQQEIAKRIRLLNKAMQQAYGVAAPAVDALVAVTGTRD